MHINASASELIQASEKSRAAAGLTQLQLARALGLTQGHYSKLAAGRAPLGRKAEAALRDWLEQQAATPPDADARRAEMRRLADEIRMQCIRLTELAASG